MANTLKLEISGMTCGHCVMHVSEELTALDAISDVKVDLNAGGVSAVDVFLNDDAEVTDEALREAIAEAGSYELVSVAR